jgi:hypothetical protein
MPAEQFIFVGFEVTDGIAAGFEACEERDKVFLSDPTYLEVVEIDDRRYVGKRIASGAARDRLEDTARSVVSLLSRIDDSFSLNPTDATLIAAEELKRPSSSGVIGVE